MSRSTVYSPSFEAGNTSGISPSDSLIVRGERAEKLTDDLDQFRPAVKVPVCGCIWSTIVGLGATVLLLGYMLYLLHGN